MHISDKGHLQLDNLVQVYRYPPSKINTWHSDLNLPLGRVPRDQPGSRLLPCSNPLVKSQIKIHVIPVGQILPCTGFNYQPRKKLSTFKTAVDNNRKMLPALQRQANLLAEALMKNLILTSLKLTTELSKFKVGKVHCANSGVYG